MQQGRLGGGILEPRDVDFLVSHQLTYSPLAGLRE
jgi:hypothetical protein